MHLDIRLDGAKCGNVKSVLLDGRDVTRDCIAFDTVDGWVELYVRQDNGAHAFTSDRRELRREILNGEVVVEMHPTIRPPEPLPVMG